MFILPFIFAENIETEIKKEANHKLIGRKSEELEEIKDTIN